MNLFRNILGDIATGSAIMLSFAAGVAQAENPPPAERIAMVSHAPEMETVMAPGPAPIWISPQGNGARAHALIAALAGAGSHGLPVERYGVSGLKAALAAADDPFTLRRAEAALTAAYLRFAGDLAAGVLTPNDIDKDLYIFPERPDDATLIAKARVADDIGALLRDMAPRDPQYARLRAELPRLRALVAGGGWASAPAPDGKLLRPDAKDPRVASLRARLRALGDLAPADVSAEAVDETRADDEKRADSGAPTPEAMGETVYDLPLLAAVQAFQRRHGLNDDGVVGRRTFAALATTAEQRLGQVLVNLERLRWMEDAPAGRRITVNEADFTVRLIDNGKTLFNERVVIGKSKKFRTPEFQDEMTYLVFNPTWNVPRSIATKEILPKLQEDPDYLLKQNMDILTPGDDAPTDATGLDWLSYSENSFPFLVKQRPGDGNALGRVKFMFPNQFNIYLHDTPSKSLFNKDARAFSHGCVRVRDPFRLAYALLASQVDDPEAYVAEILDAEEEKIVSLKSPVPVTLTYRTAWIDDQGVRQYRADVYGRDAEVLAALKALAPQRLAAD